MPSAEQYQGLDAEEPFLFSGAPSTSNTADPDSTQLLV